MGNVAYMSLFDTAGELIQGGSDVTDRKGCIEVHKINYNVSRTVDSQTGKTHSTRRHQPFTVIKHLDRATPELFDACTSGKLLSSARVDLYKINDEGCEENYLSYLLDKVRVISITPIIDAESNKHDGEAVSFSFEEIGIVYHAGNIAATDSWSVR